MIELKKILVHNLDDHLTSDFRDFIELQDDLKLRTKEQIEKLKKRIIKVGFKYDFVVWENKDGKKFIIDAHARKEVLNSLLNDGFEIPPVPYTRISAKNIEEAKKEILFFNSEYGAINKESDFINKNFDIKVDFNIEIPELLELENIKIDDKEEELNIEFEFAEELGIEREYLLITFANKQEYEEAIKNFNLQIVEEKTHNKKELNEKGIQKVIKYENLRSFKK